MAVNLKTMIRRLLMAFVCLIVFNFCHSQTIVNNQIEGNDAIIKIENYILSNELDSVHYLISNHKETPYLNQLFRISQNLNPSYSDYIKFISRLEVKSNISYEIISDYINKNVAEPRSIKDIDLDYVNIKWSQISKLRDDVTVEEASKIQTDLENYINRFNPNDVSVRKAQILASTHQIVLYIIQREIDKGKKLCFDNFKEAKDLGDKELMIMSLYYLCDFLLFEGKLDEYINTSEQSLEIERTLPYKSSYYSATLVHIIDAYIFKGGKDNRVQALLKELYDRPSTREQSYSLYAKYLGTIDLKSPIAIGIFRQFKASKLTEFSQLIEKGAAEVLNPNDLYQLQREISNTLEIHGFLKDALSYRDKTIVLTKKIYSQDLANSLASYKVKQAVKEKDLIIKHQKERTDLYMVIAVLIAGLSLILIFAYFKKKKQSKILEEKNKQINITLKEKELLVKEVHHRVKNNFQIVSSLLELQTKGIEDEKALNLATEGKNRVRSMALIHQNLYQNKDGLIDFNEYIYLLVNELTSLNTSSNKVETNLNVQNIYFDVDTAIPLGLIINELITNAYKHAFSANKKGKLNISIAKIDTDNYKLVVSDNGSGLDSNLDIKNSKSVGLRLINRLVKQIQGTLLFINNDGAQFEIIFKNTESRKIIM
tara:strand:- start:6509 stop:8473 length:1965 start_codon:yes stop_codon:yes gene_type:complete